MLNAYLLYKLLSFFTIFSRKEKEGTYGTKYSRKAQRYNVYFHACLLVSPWNGSVNTRIRLTDKYYINCAFLYIRYDKKNILTSFEKWYGEKGK